MEHGNTGNIHNKKLLITFVLLFFPLFLQAESNTDITGRWVTIDDETGKKRSIVEITERDGKIYGQISKVFFMPGDNQKCVECEGDKHNHEIVGLEIIEDLALEENVWSGGTILDPKNGRVYDCKLWLEGDDLKVRGYLFMFYRTQTWKRYRAADDVAQEAAKG